MIERNIRDVLLRELDGLARQVRAYADDDSLWRVLPGTSNPAGTLVLHLAGNLRFYFGAVLARDGYVRDRDAEFSRSGVDRAELLGEIEAAREAVSAGIAALGDEIDWSASYAEPVGGRTLSLGEFLAHIVSHTSYHLGQIDYHRRAIDGNSGSLQMISVKELSGR